MMFVRIIPASLAVLLAACVAAPQPVTVMAVPEAQPELTTVEEAHIAFIGITGTLPEEGNDLAPAALDSLMDLVPVQLDLTIRPPLELNAVGEDGLYEAINDCGFGPVNVGEVSVPTGSNHMLLSVRMGTPVDHPANLLSCDYDPSEMTEDSPGVIYRLRGCFLPQSISIPTAVEWVLNPLPASACGLGD